MGPVRIGNQAYEHHQHDVYGQIILPLTQSFFDQRLLRLGSEAEFRSLEEVGEMAWRLHDQPDAGLWELRTRAAVHTYSAAMCWAACDRLANAAETLGLEERRSFWAVRAATIRDRIEKAAWRPQLNAMSAAFSGDFLDASLIQLLDLRFFGPDDPRFQGTLTAIEAGLRRGSYLLRYAEEDDFGLPETAFTVCSFWLIEALHFTGRREDARALFEELLSHRTGAGLLSEDIDPVTSELWGNYPQTYSLVGMINCAVLLSKPWSSVR
jgi:GH15 family glucan-1,4-alpha-glucosidase